MIWLADPQDAGKAGPLGLLAIIVLGVASYFLFKSMSRHLKRVRDNFPDPDTDLRVAGPASARSDAAEDPPDPPESGSVRTPRPPADPPG